MPDEDSYRGLHDGNKLEDSAGEFLDALRAHADRASHPAVIDD